MKRGRLSRKSVAFTGILLAGVILLVGILHIPQEGMKQGSSQSMELTDAEREINNLNARDNVLSASIFEKQLDPSEEIIKTDPFDLSGIFEETVTSRPFFDQVAQPEVKNSGNRIPASVNGQLASGGTDVNGGEQSTGSEMQKNDPQTDDDKNTGDEENTGNNGNEGNTGNNGNEGNTGNNGNEGNTGNNGNEGNSGNNGNEGNSGNNGNEGNSGNNGNSGDSGNSGNTGNTGNSGDNENSGNTGNSGNSGNTGGNEVTTPSLPRFAEPGWIEKAYALKMDPVRVTAAKVETVSAIRTASEEESAAGETTDPASEEDGTDTGKIESVGTEAWNPTQTLQIIGDQIRTVEPMGLRFIAAIREEFLNELQAKSPTGKKPVYGFVAIPNKYLQASGNPKNAVLDGVYTYMGGRFRSGTIEAKKNWKRESGYIYYTAVLTDIPRDKYQELYTVRAYVQYQDENKQTITLYSSVVPKEGTGKLEAGEPAQDTPETLAASVTASGSVMDVATKYLQSENADPTTKSDLMTQLGVDAYGNRLVDDPERREKIEQAEKEAKFRLGNVKTVQLYTTGQVEVPIEPVKIDQKVLKEHASANSYMDPAGSGGNDGSYGLAFDGNTNTLWHSRYQNEVKEGEISTGKVAQALNANTPIWIQMGFGEPVDLYSIEYTPRLGTILGQNQIKEYEIWTTEETDTDKMNADWQILQEKKYWKPDAETNAEGGQTGSETDIQQTWKRVAKGELERLLEKQQIMLAEVPTDENGQVKENAQLQGKKATNVRLVVKSI